MSLDFQGKFTWSGPHVFQRPVVFSSDQRFDAAALVARGSVTGSLLHFNGLGWEVLQPPAAESVLTSSNGLVRWSKASLSASVSGILPVNRGGTGIDTLEQDGLLATRGGAFAILPSGPEGALLVSGSSGLEWRSLQAALGQGKTEALPASNDEGVLIAAGLSFQKGFLSWSHDAAGLRLYNNDIPAGLSLRGNQLRLGVNFSSLAQRRYGTDGVVLQLDIAPNRPALSCALVSEAGAAKTILSWDRQGTLTTGIVPAPRVQGVLSAAQGGTGYGSYQPGDLLYVDADGILSRLSVRGRDGYVLALSNGLPAWVPFQADHGAPAAMESPAPLPLRVVKDVLWFERHGARREVAFKDDIPDFVRRNGTLGLKEGGTGTDLSQLPAHSLLVSQGTESVSGVEIGPEGASLVSQGANKGLAWEKRLAGITARPGDGIQAALHNGVADLKVDTSAIFSPRWRGDHVFQGGVGFTQDVVLGKGLSFPDSPSRQKSEPGDLWREGDHLYFRRSGETMCLTHTVSAPAVARETLYLPICQGVSLSQGRAWPVKMPVPYRAAYPLERARWRIKRLDVRCETPPNYEAAFVGVLVNGDPLLASPLCVNPFTEQQYTIHFQQETVFSGDLLQVVAHQLAGSDLWSAWVLLESD